MLMRDKGFPPIRCGGTMTCSPPPCGWQCGRICSGQSHGGVEPLRPKLHEASYYTQENLKVLYQLVEGHWLEMVVKVTAGLGLRREEICGLKWRAWTSSAASSISRRPALPMAPQCPEGDKKPLLHAHPVYA